MVKFRNDDKLPIEALETKDNIVPDKKEEEVAEIPYKKLHNTSVRQLIRENEDRREKATQAVVEETRPQEKETVKETVKETQQEEKRKARDIEEERKAEQKAIREEATKVAREEFIKRADEEVKKITEAKQQEEDQKKREETLKPKWSGVDTKTGQPLPKDYLELNNEAVRIAEERAYDRIKKELAEKDKITSADQEKTRIAKEAEDKRLEEWKTTEIQRLNEEEKDLYSQSKLPKIKDPNNQNDWGMKVRASLYTQAQEFNAKQIADGKPPVTSLKLFYYEHFKMPKQQIAGADAPIMGNSNPPVNTDLADKYVYKRDHSKSFRQWANELNAKLRGKR